MTRKEKGDEEDERTVQREGLKEEKEEEPKKIRTQVDMEGKERRGRR